MFVDDEKMSVKKESFRLNGMKVFFDKFPVITQLLVIIRKS
jgi:hypothetical protein